MSAPRGTVVAGGGTGGHVVPSLQIARALVQLGHAPETIELYGSRRGQEASTWPTLEFPHTLLPGRGIRRSMRPCDLWANTRAVAGLAWACCRAVGSFAAHRPRVVVIVGGYASFPAGLAAVLTRVPLVSVTTDAVPGAVNGLLGRFAAANAVAFPGTNLPREHVTGTPVRSELASLDRTPEGRARSRAALGLPPDRQTVATVGGSLGALRINRAVAELAGTWAGCESRSLYQVTGRRDYGAFSSSPSPTLTPSPPPSCSPPGGSGSPEESGTTTAGAPPGAGEGDDAGGREGLWHRVVPFEDRMWLLYGAADVCVTRAGAMTVAELLVTGVPAILVPLPGAPRDHQTRNAEALVGMGAAVHLPDAECDGRRLAKELDALFSDPDRLRAMREAASVHGHPDAAARVAELVDAHAR